MGIVSKATGCINTVLAMAAGRVGCHIKKIEHQLPRRFFLGIFPSAIIDPKIMIVPDGHNLMVIQQSLESGLRF